MSGDGEAPRTGGPVLAGVRDADPRTDHDPIRGDRVGRIRGVALQSERTGRIAQVRAGPRRVDPERGGNKTRTAREPVIRRASQAAEGGGGAGLGPCRSTASIDLQTVGPHQVDPDQRFRGPDQHGRWSPGRLGDHVQTVVHPVDKVHVGDARWPRHDPITAPRQESGVRRSILGPRVGLDLDDARLAAPGLVVADEAGAKQDGPG